MAVSRSIWEGVSSLVNRSDKSRYTDIFRGSGESDSNLSSKSILDFAPSDLLSLLPHEEQLEISKIEIIQEHNVNTVINFFIRCVS